ncbi:MAG: DUF4114 domain-containing protein [Limnothrix sp. CACIAM 69d]|nr:MAG: DUF4114 domain-containing protein [Limnothrix sp. CACIAM 69d]
MSSQSLSGSDANSSKRRKPLRWQRLERLNTPSPIVPLSEDLDEIFGESPAAVEPPLPTALIAPEVEPETVLPDLEGGESEDPALVAEVLDGGEIGESSTEDGEFSEAETIAESEAAESEPVEPSEAIASSPPTPLSGPDPEGEIIEFVPATSEATTESVASKTNEAPALSSPEATASTDPLAASTEEGGSSEAIEAEAEIDDPEDGAEAELLIPTALPEPDPRFQSGIFTVGGSGQVVVDVLWDGGAYRGQAGIFSLSGMESYELGSVDFIAEMARRVTSDSVLGYVIWNDPTEAARFSGVMNGEADFNSGAYAGLKSFEMQAGDKFGVVLVPDTTFVKVLEQPWAEGSWRPLFSMVTANPNDSFQMGQIADVTGDGNTFTFEDIRVDHGGDKDYNDFIFQVRGATGEAVLMDEVVAPGKDWRNTDAGQLLVSYAKQYVEAPIEGGVPPSPDGFAGDDGLLPAPPLDFEPSAGEALPNPADGVLPDGASNLPGPLPIYTETQFEFPAENQPVIGIIDTGFAGNNPDFKFNNITWGKDYVSGDLDPTLAAGEGSQHGTHILGVIAAQQDNGVGIDGINPDAPIFATRAIGSGAWAAALTDTVDHIKTLGQPNGVVNLSLDLTQRNPDGSITTRYELTPQERGAIEYARQNGVVLVVAAGNDGGVMSVLGQASQEFDNIVTVGAVERANGDVSLYLGTDRVDYASYGDGLTVVADGGTPENPVLSTVDDGVGTMAGTSVATARVTGVVSQIWAANPDLSYRQVIDILKQTATDLGATGWDAATGAGLVNLAAAISLARMTVGEGKIDPEDFLTPTTWGGEGEVAPTERAVAFRSENFRLRLWPSDGVNLRNSPNSADRSSVNLPMNTWLNFDGWDYGTVNIDPVSKDQDALYYRTTYNGRIYWVPGIWVDGYPPSRPSLLPPAAPAPTPTPSPSPAVNWRAAIDAEHQATRNLLGNPTSDYFPASRSPQGTTGYFRYYENGTIHWSPQYGAVALWLDLNREYGAYGSPNGSAGWLGYPTRREYPWNGGMRTDFEGGYIFWDGQRARAVRTSNPAPTPAPAPAPSPTRSLVGKKIALDPGHGNSPGGFDPGALGNGTNEAAENLVQARLIADYLRQRGAEVTVIDDGGLSLVQIGQRSSGSDIFVSLHLNAFNRQAQGHEVYSHPTAPAADRQLAQTINNELDAAFPDAEIPNRGTKTADFGVLRGAPTNVPAVLVESLFIDSPGMSRGNVEKAALAIGRGIERYLTGQVTGGSVAPAPAPTPTPTPTSTSTNIILRPTSTATLSFSRGQTWRTSTGYQFIFQTDGNLVLYSPQGQAIWATGTENTGANRLSIQSDGNVVLYADSRPLWATNTSGNPEAYFAIQHDGNLVVYSSAGRALFSSGTDGGTLRTRSASAEWLRGSQPVTSLTPISTIWNSYKSTLGNPTSEITTHSSGATYQLFQNGSIVSSRHGTFPLYGAIRQSYQANSGLNGWLGAPTSAEQPQGNGVITQTFEGGYIIWNGRTATAYKNGSGSPSTSIPPTPQPGSGMYGNPENFYSWAIGQTGITRLDGMYAYRGQCVTLIARYIQEVFLSESERSKSRAFGDGKDTARVVASTLSNQFSPATSVGLPKRGAVISFPGIGVVNGIRYGHVGIVMAARQLSNGQRQVQIMDSNGDGLATNSKVTSRSTWINIPDGSASGYGSGIYWTNPK